MITSTSNSQVKYLVQLQNKSKLRKEKQEFVVEGIKMVQEIPVDRIVKIYASESFVENNQMELEAIDYKRYDSEVVTDAVFSQMSDTKTPQGIMAIVRMVKYTYTEIVCGKPFVLALENLQDPGNLGTILRVAEGAGVTGIVMSPNTVDIYNPKTIRSTMGSIFRMPFLYASDFIETLEHLKKDKVTLYAAHLDGKNAYTKVDYRSSSAFLIGNEGNGLSDVAASKADILIRIPMCGKVESLNAAIATSILSYEAKRQRDEML